MTDAATTRWRRGTILLGTSVGWTVAHFMASHVYVSLCTPMTFTGFVTSPLTVGAPHCSALRWFMNTGALNIHSAWIGFGAAAALWLAT